MSSIPCSACSGRGPVWAAGDQRSRGFLVGGTPGAPRSTAKACSTRTGTPKYWPGRCRTASPTIRPSPTKWRSSSGRPAPHGHRTGGRLLLPDGDERELRAPGTARGAAAGILKGMYQFRKGAASNGPRVQLLGSGTIFREAIAAAELLKRDWNVEADLWSCPVSTSWPATGTRIARAGTCCIRRAAPLPCRPPASPKRADRWSLPRTMCAPFAEQVRPYCRGTTPVLVRTVRPLRYARKAAPLRGRPALDRARGH